MKKQSKTNLKAAASYRNGDIRRWMKAAKENYIEEKCLEAYERVIEKGFQLLSTNQARV